MDIQRVIYEKVRDELWLAMKAVANVGEVEYALHEIMEREVRVAATAACAAVEEAVRG